MVLFSIINFISLLCSFFIMAYFYTLSIQPMKRFAKYGDKAWRDCKNFRSISGFGELLSVINLVLWIWFPLPIVSEWIISANVWIGIIIGIFITVPCVLIMVKGLKDAGSETLSPSKNTEMYGGIYNHIRHPQTLGEFPTFVAISFFFNSWFLVILSSLFIIIYTPIMIHYEEIDLVKRFGEKYTEYQKRTGALFPKLKRHQN
ncbi:hypothetical protein ES703_61817 [subsurface metagenome]